MIKFGVLQQQSAILFAVKSYRKHLLFYSFLTFCFLFTSFVIGALIEYSWLLQNYYLYRTISLIIPLLSFSLQLFTPLIFFAANIIVFYNQTPNWNRIKETLYPHFLVLIGEYVIVTLLYGVVVFLGSLVFIIPGIYFLVRYQYSAYLIIDKKYDPLKAMQYSGRMTKNNIWQLFLFDLTLGAFNVLGMFFLGLGLLISIPISLLAFVYTYKYLLGELPSEQNPPRAYVEKIL